MDTHIHSWLRNIRRKDVGAGCFISVPNGETLESASTTGKFLTNDNAEVKAQKQGAPAMIDLTDTNCSISHRFLVSIRLTIWAWRTQPQVNRVVLTQFVTAVSAPFPVGCVVFNNTTSDVNCTAY